MRDQLELPFVELATVAGSSRTAATRPPASKPLMRTGGVVAAESSYNHAMTLATSRVEVGVRDLKNNLSRYLDRVQDGEEVIVTEHGKPVARLSSLHHPSDRLAALIASGAVRPPKSKARHRPVRRIKAKGSVSEFVAAQRR